MWQIPVDSCFQLATRLSGSFSTVVRVILAVALLCVSLQAVVAQKGDEFSPRKLTEKEVREGWIALFDGSTLFGWRKETDANWQISDGVITADQGGAGLLRTTTQFDDFVLKVDFRSTETTNSGIFFRTSPKPRHPAFDCYEVGIHSDDDDAFPTGSIVARTKTDSKVKTGQWHRCQITAVGGFVKVSIDGEQVATYEDKKPLGKGYIGFQFHEGKVEFANVFLKPLNLKSIFNGKDLLEWNQYPNPKTSFKVVDESIHVKGGPGQLETKGEYADFILQLECKTNAPRLNSGVFFRCIPTEKMNGYECQIHNGFRNKDRSIPEDCGTGGIFRRQNARRIVANDEEWFHLTVIADGTHFCAWVNGEQVSDWSDKRTPDANPRRGYRQKAGTIMLQAHDLTTDILFKNLNLREINKRR